jgi:hypothetical protein
LIRFAINLSDDNSEICLLYVIIIPREKELDIEDHKSFQKAEKILKQLEQEFQNTHGNIYGEIIQARHAGAAIIEIAKINNPQFLIIGANKCKNTTSKIGLNASYILNNQACSTIIYKE